MAIGGPREELVGTLNAAFAAGLLSENTLAARMDQVLHARLIDPGKFVGDLWLRSARPRFRERLLSAVVRMRDVGAAALAQPAPTLILALDWASEPQELVVGRSSGCDVVIAEPTVSRRHARLVCRDGRWVFCDLDSTNGSFLDGRRVGRCELRRGDQLSLGALRLRID
ncbi:MAG: FHA domain-containing protein [Solirubrobacteraceae bacterium]